MYSTQVDIYVRIPDAVWNLGLMLPTCDNFSKYWHLLCFSSLEVSIWLLHTNIQPYTHSPAISTSLTCTFWTLHDIWCEDGCLCLGRGLHGTQCFAPHISLYPFPKGPTSAILKQIVGFFSSSPEVSSVEEDFSFQTELSNTISDIQYYLKFLLISSPRYNAEATEGLVLKQGEIIW